MRHLTVRNVPDDLARSLDAERRRRGLSLNQTVIDLLSQATGVTPQAVPDNGLASFAGTWSAADLQEFEQATRAFRTVDAEMWR
jgi:plasmid stability protein